MDKLKQYIQNNREEFDREELPPGHEYRFMQKLSRKKSRVREIAWYAAAFAASVVILLLMALPFSGEKNSLPSGVTSEARTVQINELQLYYTMQMQDVIDRIEAFNPGSGMLEKQQVLKEAKRVLAMSELFGESVVPQLPVSDETLFAVTQYYGTSLNSLNFMLEQIQSDIK